MLGAEVLHRSGLEKKSSRKSMKGVLGKNDLAEVYNCEKKTGKFGMLRRKSRVEIQSPPPTVAAPVKSVEFQEAVLEQILDSQRTQSERRISREETRVISVVRKISQSNLLHPVEPNNNNNFNWNKSPSVRNVNPQYEPENSLRRISTIDRPTLIQDKGNVVRRRSTLDKPNLLQLQSPATNGDGGASSADYEPENALGQVQKATSDSQGTSGNRRQRRSGLSLIAPTISNHGTHLTTEERSVAAKTPTCETCSPKTHKVSVTQRPLFSLSIPEDNTVITETSLATSIPSPKAKRKTSVGRPRPLLSQHSLDCSNTTHSPMIKRQSSVTSQLPKRGHSLPNSNSHSLVTGNSQSLASSSKTEDSTSSASNSSTSSIDRFKFSISKYGGSHSNTTRYWDWYVLNASYGWKNFNSDKFFCY